MHQLVVGWVRTACALVLVVFAGRALPAQAENQYRYLPIGGSLSIMWSDSGTRAVCTGQKGLGLEAVFEAVRLEGRADLPSVSTRYTTVGGDIIVDFTGFTPDAEAAFQSAVDILAGQLNLDIPIHVEAKFEALEEGILGAAGPNGVFLPTDPSSGLPAVPPALPRSDTGKGRTGPRGTRHKSDLQ